MKKKSVKTAKTFYDILIERRYKQIIRTKYSWENNFFPTLWTEKRTIIFKYWQCIRIGNLIVENIDKNCALTDFDIA